jgi:hypothetical protein
LPVLRFSRWRKQRALTAAVRLQTICAFGVSNVQNCGMPSDWNAYYPYQISQYGSANGNIASQRPISPSSSPLARAPFGKRAVSGLLSLCRAPDYFYRAGGGRTDPKPIA